MGVLRPHRQCWDSAVVNVAARLSRPPTAAHSAASAAFNMPGVNTAHARPHSRNHAPRWPSSTVSRTPWAAVIRSATRLARACLASVRPACSARVRVRSAR
ncbi:hypothetical protein ABGB12_13255 [Actinocorallia sp. B10E7]|uniref:hypothetical protein n=1 Tax=Actinocorallia sp. B10E7 TaxID=3153558 RepID=UPI00325E173F